MTLLTIKFRLKDRHSHGLLKQARAVNFVWNYCNETQQKAARAGRKWLTAVDLQRLTAGASKELDLHAHTIQNVCQQYDKSRCEKRKPWLRFRGRKSLGWVPFNQGHVTVVAPSQGVTQTIGRRAGACDTLPHGQFRACHVSAARVCTSLQSLSSPAASPARGRLRLGRC